MPTIGAIRLHATNVAWYGSCSLVFAADIMKSEMRGTISERNREPLNTP